MTFTFKNTEALAAVIDFVNNFRMIPWISKLDEEIQTEKILEFITSREPLLMTLLEIVGSDNLEIAYTESERLAGAKERGRKHLESD
jgi:hypothetical protein